MEQTPVMIANPVLSVDKNGCVLYSNEAGYHLLNEWDVRVGEKLPSHIGNIVQRVISQNNPEKTEIKAGSRTYLVVFSPLPEQECVNISGFDISDQTEFEEKLWESEERFRSAFDDSAVAMALVCPDARLLKVNDAFCRLLGFEKSEMEGRTFLDFTHPEDIESSILIHKAVINRDKPFFWLEKRYIRKGGRVIWCEVSSSPVFDYKGCPIYTVAHVQDITERKEAEEALKKARNTLEEKVKERTAELEKAYNLLKESEKGLAEAQRMARIGNWDWDLITGEVYWSDEMYRIFGRNPQVPLGTFIDFLNYIHPDDRKYVDDANKKRLKGEPVDIDHRVILADGEERTVHSQVEIIFDEGNRPIRLKGIVQDITERKKAEEKIERLANIVEYTNDGIGLITPEGLVLEWNKGEENIYGYDVEDIVGRHISIIAPPHLKNEPMDHVELLKQTYTSFNYTTSRLRKDGKMIEVSITLAPVLDSHGKLTAISFITRDITEQKMYEERLRLSEEKYRNIVETANEGIWLVDAELRTTYVNKKMVDMLGYRREEMIGRLAQDYADEECKTILKQQQEKRRRGISESYILKLIRKDGTPIWAFVNTKSLFDKNGKFMGSLGMVTDITERKKAEDALTKIEIARKQEIHHRIKNNLQIISSLLDLQVEKLNNREYIKESEVKETFRESQDRVISMALIHEELHKGGELDTLNFSHYIEELADNLLLTYRLGNESISLNMDIKEAIYFDMDTSVPLGIIVNELVSNSLKHAFSGRDKGEIQIKLCREEGSNASFILIVSDNGIGIPEDIEIEDLDSLGLQLVFTLVEQLDGELELKIDNGTKFKIKFSVKGNNDQELIPGQTQLADND